MIEDGIKVIDRIISLLNTRKEQRVAILSNHIEPIFSSMETIHKNYLISIDELVGEFEDKKDIDVIIASIKRRKLAMENMRVKVDSYAKEGLRQKANSDCTREFFDCCMKYFSAQSWVIDHPYIGSFTRSLEEISELKKKVVDLDDENQQYTQHIFESVPIILVEEQAGLRKSWELLTKSYSKCKFELA